MTKYRPKGVSYTEEEEARRRDYSESTERGIIRNVVGVQCKPGKRGHMVCAVNLTSKAGFTSKARSKRTLTMNVGIANFDGANYVSFSNRQAGASFGRGHCSVSEAPVHGPEGQDFKFLYCATAARAKQHAKKGKAGDDHVWSRAFQDL